MGPQFGLGSGDNNVSQIGPVNIRITCVTASHVEIENVLGESAHCQNGSELFFGIIMQIRSGQVIRDRSAAPQYSSFLVSGSQKIARRTTREHQAQYQSRNNEQSKCPGDIAGGTNKLSQSMQDSPTPATTHISWAPLLEPAAATPRARTAADTIDGKSLASP